MSNAPRISVYYGPVDQGFSRHSFKTLEAARAYARRVIGPEPILLRGGHTLQAADGSAYLQASIPLTDLVVVAGEAH